MFPTTGEGSSGIEKSKVFFFVLSSSFLCDETVNMIYVLETNSFDKPERIGFTHKGVSNLGCHLDKA